MAKQEKTAGKTTSKKITIQPIGERVLVMREDAPDKKSVSGIIIPDTAQKEKSKRGVVIAVGEGRTTEEGKLVAAKVKVGSSVYFNAGWDNEVDLGDDNDYFLVKESDILAIIK